jgi:hypothetical protein
MLGGCFRMVQARQIQATDSRHEPASKGTWTEDEGCYQEGCRE